MTHSMHLTQASRPLDFTCQIGSYLNDTIHHIKVLSTQHFIHGDYSFRCFKMIQNTNDNLFSK